jgi:hypothetical protein
MPRQIVDSPLLDFIYYAVFIGAAVLMTHLFYTFI